MSNKERSNWEDFGPAVKWLRLKYGRRLPPVRFEKGLATESGKPLEGNYNHESGITISTDARNPVQTLFHEMQHYFRCSTGQCQGGHTTYDPEDRHADPMEAEVETQAWSDYYEFKLWLLGRRYGN